MESLGSNLKREQFEKKAVASASKILPAMYRRTKPERGEVHEQCGLMGFTGTESSFRFRPVIYTSTDDQC